MRVKITILAFAFLLGLNLWAKEEAPTEGWNESALLPYIENAQQVAWQSEKNENTIKPTNDWWKSPIGMAAIAFLSALAGYILFVLRRKRKLQKAQAKSAQREGFANDPLWACSNNPRLRITVDQLSEALERMQGNQ